MAATASKLHRWFFVLGLLNVNRLFSISFVMAGNKLQRLRKKQINNPPIQTPNRDFHLYEQNRYLDEGQFGGSSPGTKCTNLLQQTAGNDFILDQAEYVKFLHLLSGGEISGDSLDDIGGIFATSFYQAACAQFSQCDTGNEALIVSDESVLSQPILELCDKVMKHVITRASVTFGYSIRYEADSVSVTLLPGCLEKATKNLLLDNFGCHVDVTVAQSQRRQLLLRRSNSRVEPDIVATNWEEERIFTALLLREQEDRRFLASTMSMDDFCEYDIDVQVPMILNLGCNPPTAEGSNINCGLVRSSVTVEAPQNIEPVESELRSNITEALRLAIDGDSFENFFPEECLVDEMGGQGDA